MRNLVTGSPLSEAIPNVLHCPRKPDLSPVPQAAIGQTIRRIKDSTNLGCFFAQILVLAAGRLAFCVAIGRCFGRDGSEFPRLHPRYPRVIAPSRSPRPGQRPKPPRSAVAVNQMEMLPDLQPDLPQPQRRRLRRPLPALRLAGQGNDRRGRRERSVLRSGVRVGARDSALDARK